MATVGTAVAGRGRPPRVVCFSAYADNLRARALANGLRRAGWDVIESRGRGGRSTPWELLATLLPNCWLALRTRSDVALGCKPHPNVTLPLMICRRRGIRTWLDVDDLDHAYRPGLLGRVVDRLQRPHPRRADVVSYHHPALRTHLEEALGCDPERMLAVAQGVHVDRFARPRAPLSAFDGRPRVVFAAHLNLACDLEVVLSAWPRVLVLRPAALLTVVGGGARLGEFRRQVDDQGLSGSVVLVGEVRPSEVPAYLAGADVAVAWATDRLVNRHRCFLKLREYLAAGLPVVCNDVGELVDFATVTYQVAGGPEQLAGELVRLLDGEGDGREEAGRRLAEQLDWQPIVAAAAAAVADRLDLDIDLPTLSGSTLSGSGGRGGTAPVGDGPGGGPTVAREDAPGGGPGQDDAGSSGGTPLGTAAEAESSPVPVTLLPTRLRRRP